MTDTPPDPGQHKDLLIAMLTELGASMRIRTEPEHLYTAAAVGGFGAVTWDVAALQPTVHCVRSWWSHPALVAATGVVVVAWTVWRKLKREHNRYAEMKEQQITVAALLNGIPGVQRLIPAEITLPAGWGHHYSMPVVVAAALAAVAFCVAMYLVPPMDCPARISN